MAARGSHSSHGHPFPGTPRAQPRGARPALLNLSAAQAGGLLNRAAAQAGGSHARLMGARLGHAFKPRSFGDNRARGAPSSSSSPLGSSSSAAAPPEDEGEAQLLGASRPHLVLGVDPNEAEEDIRAAFRGKIKAYHPDVYRGAGDPEDLTRRLVLAYEALLRQVERREGRGLDGLDSDNNWEEDDLTLWVNELRCAGRACRYSCVVRAPNTFFYSPDTGCARLRNSESRRGLEDGEYTIQLAVGQCPALCIHYVTRDQEALLTDLLQRVLSGEAAPGQTELEVLGMISQFEYENNRRPAPKQKPKSSTANVDWY